MGYMARLWLWMNLMLLLLIYLCAVGRDMIYILWKVYINSRKGIMGTGDEKTMDFLQGYYTGVEWLRYGDMLFGILWKLDDIRVFFFFMVR